MCRCVYVWDGMAGHWNLLVMLQSVLKCSGIRCQVNSNNARWKLCEMSVNVVWSE